MICFFTFAVKITHEIMKSYFHITSRSILIQYAKNMIYAQSIGTEVLEGNSNLLLLLMKFILVREL